MKRNMIFGVFCSIVGIVLLFILPNAAGIVGARGADASGTREETRLNAVSAATPLTSTFTYQGQLKNGGNAVNGSCQMAFRLYDDPVLSTNLIAGPITPTVPVTNGLFTVGLNFGSNAFSGNGRWLDIQVDCGGGYVPLTTRQAITAAPYSHFSLSTGALQSYPVTTTAPSSGQVLKWNGSAWIPDADNNTTYSNGFGLNLAGTVFNVVTSTIQTRVSSACGAGFAIRTINADGSVTCEPVSIGNFWGLTGNMGTNPKENFLGTTDAQALVFKTRDTEIMRVDEYGNVGIGTTTPSAKLTVAGLISTTGGVEFADGTIQTTAYYRPILPGPGVVASVDSAGNVGMYSSIIIGADGLGLISYYDVTSADLKVLHCGNAACNSGNTTTTVDSAGDVGYWTSITIGADGLGLISYYDNSNLDLKVLHCGNAACNSGNTATTVDNSAFNVGWYPSITIGADGLGLISYRDDTPNNDLKVLHCGNAACTGGGNISTTVDSAGNVGQFTSVTIGADGLGLISYFDSSNSDLKVLHCGNAACNSGNTATTVDSTGAVGYFTSVTIGADGLGLISYWDAYNLVLKVLHCGNAACDSGNTATIVDNSAPNVGQYTSVTVGADGLGLISHYDFTNNDLKVLHCGNSACNSGNTATTLDSAGDVGRDTSITIGADGRGLISYRDLTNGDLKVFHCSNLTCTPYTRVGR